MNGLDALVFAQRVRDAAFSKIAASGFDSFGRGSRICLPFRVGNARNIAIGSNVLIGAGSFLMVPMDDAPKPALIIQSRVRMHQTGITAVESVIIGEAVEIARGVYISDHSHGFEVPGIPIRDQPLIKIAPVSIGAGSWIGQNAVVLPGVTIGEGAVIGANSVVREDVPARCVAVGAPARTVRRLS